MSENKIAEILSRYLNNECTPEEKISVEAWFESHGAENTEFGIMDEQQQAAWMAKLFTDIQTTNRQNEPKRRLWTRLSAAAALFIIMGLSVYFYLNKTVTLNLTEGLTEQVHDAQPGGNKAYLTLDDGRRISLDSLENGLLANQGGILVDKTEDGVLVYSVSNTPTFHSETYNKIETPKGGQYQIVLPDGTRVWLNAASQLRFPTNLKELAVRRVELIGEAYFEVAQQQSAISGQQSEGNNQHSPLKAKKPFIVMTDKQAVDVLGTHFNINAYADEVDVRTTLMEGSVKVRSLVNNIHVLLSPGEESLLRNENFKVQKIDVGERIDWKNGKFIFNNASLDDIMKKISRWYDLDIEYQQQVNRRETFSGTVSRFENVSKVLRRLELTGEVQFEIKDHKIIVLK